GLVACTPRIKSNCGTYYAVWDFAACANFEDVWICSRIAEKKVIMDKEQLIQALIASRGSLESIATNPLLQAEAEGGCGVIGLAANVPIAGKHLLQALQQMRNRGNGKGGGAAAVGLDPDFFGVQPGILANDYLLAIAYLDSSVRTKLESTYIEPTFIV